MTAPASWRTPDVPAVIAAANEAIARGNLVYAERNKIQFMIYRLPLRDLVRLNEIIASLTEDELKRVVAFAEGLVEWKADAPQAAQTG